MKEGRESAGKCPETELLLGPGCLPDPILCLFNLLPLNSALEALKLVVCFAGGMLTMV
jgi:hypothetical protein